MRFNTLLGDGMDEGAAKRGRLLVVDDEALILELLREYFTRAGYSVDVASDGFAGEALARERSYDLVLMDVRLPGISGPETAHRISAVRPDLPFVFMTGFGGLGDEQAVPGRTLAVVDKPLHLAGLEDLVARALEERSPGRAPAAAPSRADAPRPRDGRGRRG